MSGIDSERMLDPQPGSVSVVGKPRLLDEIRRALGGRHDSRRIEHAYVQWIRRFVVIHQKRRPREMGAPEVYACLTHLAVERRVAASTQNQALAALIYLYDRVLEQRLGIVAGIVRARRPRRLPVILTRSEVREVLSQIEGTSRLVATLLDGSGLRLLECLGLRVKEIEFVRGKIVVWDGKGQQDRVTMLPVAAKGCLSRRRTRWRRTSKPSGGSIAPTSRGGLGWRRCRTRWRGSTRRRIASGGGSGSSRRRRTTWTERRESVTSTTCTRRSSSERSSRRCVGLTSRSARLATPSATRLRRTCSRTATTPGRCKSRSAIRTSRRR